jgi:hypothetical protein
VNRWCGRTEVCVGQQQFLGGIVTELAVLRKLSAEQSALGLGRSPQYPASRGRFHHPQREGSNGFVLCKQAAHHYLTLDRHLATFPLLGRGSGICPTSGASRAGFQFVDDDNQLAR